MIQKNHVRSLYQGEYMRPVNLYLLTRDIDKNTYTEFS